MTPPLNTTERFLYLAPSEVIDCAHPTILALSRELTADAASDVDRTRAVYEWMQREVPHAHDVGRQEVTCTASDVLAARTGICFAQSHLFAALLRAAGVPVGFCYQVTESEDSEAEATLHGLNAVHFDDIEGKSGWVRFDVRGNAPFATDGTSLAYPNDPFLDEAVHPQPLPHVVETLQRHQTMKTLWSDLPTVRGARER